MTGEDQFSTNESTSRSLLQRVLVWPGNSRTSLPVFTSYTRTKTKSPGPDLAGHVGKVYGVSFSPDGQFLASSGDDATVRVWNMTTMQPARITVALPQDQSATISEAGQLLSDPEEAGDALVYVVQGEGGALELLTPAEFPARASAKAAASDSE